MHDGRRLLAASLASALCLGGTDPRASAAPLDCEALKASTVPYELVIRLDNRTVVRNGEKRAIPPQDDRLRVLRGSDGQVTTFAHDGTGRAPTVSRKAYWRTLEVADPTYGRSVITYDAPLDHDPVASREDWTEAYTVTAAGQPTIRRRMQAVFLGEGTFDLGPCRFKVHRYRTTLFAEPSPDGTPLSTTIADYAPELTIPLRQAATSSVVTQTRTATAITTELQPLPGTQ